MKLGARYLFHDARGVRGPYEVVHVHPGGQGYSVMFELVREDAPPSRITGEAMHAFATGRSLGIGVNNRGIGWEAL